LVRPCACRGTMSGVHASCVEQWVTHHREVAAGVPQCPVCHQPYVGFDRRPDLGTFARIIGCSAAVQRCVRWIIFFSVIQAFAWMAANPSHHLPLPAGIVLDVAFLVAGVLETASLTVSLPPGCDPPQSQVLRQLHIGDRVQLLHRILDAVFAVLIMGQCCWSKVLPLYFLVFTAFPIVPLSRLISRYGYRSFHCSTVLRVCRWLIFFFVIQSYAWEAAKASHHIPLPARVALDAVFFVAGMLETTALTVSLPPDCHPPLNHVLRHLYIGNRGDLFKRIGDAACAVLAIAVWCFSHVLPLYYLACIGFPLLPLSRMISSKEACLRSARIALKCTVALLLSPLATVVGVLASPFILGWWLYVEGALHPLAAGPHIMITFAAAILLVIHMIGGLSQAPVVVILATHTLFLAGGLVELHCIRYWRWRRDARLWAMALSLSLFFVLALLWSLLRGSVGEIAKSTEAVVAVIWLTLFVALSEGVAGHFRSYYRSWQQRHSTFALLTPNAMLLA